MDVYSEKLLIKKIDNLKIEGLDEEKMFIDIKLPVGGSLLIRAKVIDISKKIKFLTSYEN